MRSKSADGGGSTHSDSPKPSKEYLANDFSIFNTYADGLIARDGVYTRFRWNELWQSRLKLVILGLIAALVLVLILFFVWKLFQEQPIFSGVGGTASLPPEIVYVPVPVPDPNLSQVIEKQVIVEVPKYIPIEIPAGKDVVTNFNIFRTVQVRLPGVSEVTTGIEFASSEDTFPVQQWCYANGRKKVGNSAVRMDVAHVDRTSDPQWLSMTPQEAQESGVSVGTFQQLAASCLFMTPGESYVEDAPVGSAEDVEPTPQFSSGSGFAVNTEGFILTNEHVVGECTNHKILFNNELYEARVVASDAQLDLAVVQTSSRVTRSSFEFAETARTGESVIALGYPLFDALGVSLKVTSGIISSLSGFRDDPTSLQFSAPIQPGNSGGPLVNDRNEVVAVAAAILTGDDVSNVGFAIKGAQAQRFLAKNRVDFNTGNSGLKISVPEIAERAEQTVFLIICY
jgi:S1-C subfamily serine protease